MKNTTSSVEVPARLTYAQAKAAAKKSPNRAFESDGGEGWVVSTYWCPRRKRHISQTWNPTTGASC